MEKGGVMERFIDCLVVMLIILGTCFVLFLGSGAIYVGYRQYKDLGIQSFYTDNVRLIQYPHGVTVNIQRSQPE
jgi:hypothetical protein